MSNSSNNGRWQMLSLSFVALLFVALAALFREHGKESQRKASQSTDPALDARMERLEQAMESIALEIERIGEGQRFVTKVLAERDRTAPDRVASSLPSSITPH